MKSVTLGFYRRLTGLTKSATTEKSMIMTTNDRILDIVDKLGDIPDDMQRDLARGVAILKEAGCQQVYVFGSIAEGHVRPDSDIDFAVRGCPAKLFFKLQGRLLVELRRSADLIDLDADPDLAAFLEREAAMIHVD